MDPAVSITPLTAADVPQVLAARAPDAESGPADARMAPYLEGQHHPQKSLATRTAFGAWRAGSLIGYVGGHLSTRFGCQGELQYLYVVPAERRQGVGTQLLMTLAHWLAQQKAVHIVAGDEDNARGRAFLLHHGATPWSPDPSYHIWTDLPGALRASE